MAAVIELENVTFRYANHKEAALHDVSLAIEPGECVVVTGPSGCGKTTLTRLVNGLIPHAYEGEVLGSVHVKAKMSPVGPRMSWGCALDLFSKIPEANS